MIAALFVETDGAYFNLPGVEPFDKSRDARTYNGDWRVIAHPPCERWGNFWYGGLMLHKQGKRKILGDDGGCFASALAAVRRCGGVLEHPRYSRAWPAFGIAKPPNEGGWIPAGDDMGWTCCVYQGSYGHQALKPTWLYYVGPNPPELQWGKPAGNFRPVSGRNFKSTADRRAAIDSGWRDAPRLSSKERAHTPTEFRDLLIDLARRAPSKED